MVLKPDGLYAHVLCPANVNPQIVAHIDRLGGEEA